MQSFKITAGDTALITGATAGIGLEFSRELASRGAHLVLVARNADRLQTIASELQHTFGINVEVMVADLSTRSDCDAVAIRAGKLDVQLVINNAGFGLNQSFFEDSVEAEQALLDVLVNSVMCVTHSALRSMKERNRGGVINVSSVAGWMTSGTYSAAKSWVTVFSESLAQQLQNSPVHVMALCPGFTRTEFQDRAGMSTDTIPNWMWLDARYVVQRALQDFESGKPISVPGPQYKLLSFIAKYFPRAIVRNLSVRSRRR